MYRADARRFAEAMRQINHNYRPDFSPRFSNYAKIRRVPAEEAVINVAPQEREKPSPAGFWESPWPWLALLFVLQLGAPYLPIPNRTAALAAFLLSTALYVYAVVQAIALGTRGKLPAFVLTAGLLGCALLWWILDKWGIPLAGGALREAFEARRRPAASQIFVFQLAQTAQSAALIGASVFGGSLVARLITAPNMLGPICGVIALIDIWGVLFSGPVAQMLEKVPEIAQKAMPALPAAGALSKGGANFAIQPLQIGAGDYLFLGLLFAALHLNNMNWRSAAKLATPFIFVLLMVVFFTGWALPGLPAIGLAVALPNLRYFQFTREENFAMLWAGLLVIVLSIGAYFAVQKVLPDKKSSQPPMNTDKR